MPDASDPTTTCFTRRKFCRISCSAVASYEVNAEPSPMLEIVRRLSLFFRLLLLLPPLVLAEELLELLELLHPAASTTVPIAATVATIALFVRKVVPPMPPPGGKRTLSSWLDKCSWLRTTVNGRLLDYGPQPSVLSRFIPNSRSGLTSSVPVLLVSTTSPVSWG